MRLLDPRDAPAAHRAGASIEDAPEERRRLSAQRLTFLQLHTPSMWRTARDKDGCPAVYTNLESYRRGASKDVENTFVWILETVCREMDVSGDETDVSDGAGEGGKFTILLDASTCSTHTRDFKAAAWIACCANLGRVLQTALKRGFRGRLHKFYVYPTGKAARSLLQVIKPFLGKYTPPKIVMVDAGDLAKLGEVFGVDALPIHLGGRSELLSVPLSGDGDEEREAVTSSLSATEKPLETSGNDERRPRRDLDDYAWFLRVPAFNFLVFAALVATSARAPALDSTLNDGKRQRLSRTRRDAGFRVARNATVWHVIGSRVLGLDFAGWLSACVTVGCAWWREVQSRR